MDSFPPFDSDFDLDCGDLFNGLPGSPRKTAFITQEHCNSTTPYPNGFIARATASSLFVRKNSDDDNATEVSISGDAEKKINKKNKVKVN